METEVGKTPIGRSAYETAQGIQEQTKEKVQSLKEEAVDRGRKYLEQQKGTAAEYIKDVADAMETAAAQLDNTQRKTTSGYIRSASRELKRWSSSLREHGVDSLARQVQAFAGRHPGMLLSTAAVAGFAVTRVFRSAERETAVRPQAEYSPESAYRPAQGGYRVQPAGQTPAAEKLGPHS